MHEWGIDIRYRVKYRRDHGGNEPTRQEVKAAKESKDAFKGVDARDIEEDFNSGKEVC